PVDIAKEEAAGRVLTGPIISQPSAKLLSRSFSSSPRPEASFLYHQTIFRRVLFQWYEVEACSWIRQSRASVYKSQVRGWRKDLSVAFQSLNTGRYAPC